MKLHHQDVARLPWRLANLQIEDGLSIGVELAGRVLDLSGTAARLGCAAPGDMDELLQHQRSAEVEAIVDSVAERPEAACWLDQEALRFAPLVTRPEKILCIGFNYRQHAEETGTPIPQEPPVFGKYRNALNHHGGTIVLPTQLDDRFDFETELVLVIGRGGRNIPENEALASIAGYAIGNDFSARTRQTATSQFGAGKLSDGFAPLGPWLVPAGLVVDPNDLSLTTDVNGERRQDWRTNDMIFDCRKLIAYLSRIMTLSPGDLIFTGTPQGVIFGEPAPAEERRWLRAGDHILSRIEGLGELAFHLT